MKIKSLRGLEILDSRGRPTVQATCELATGEIASAQVPSGASTGKAEALELRDGDSQRYGGLGCLKAVANIDGPIAEGLLGREIDTQAEVDGMLLALDGTPNKSKLGANATLAVSIATARASAKLEGVPLYEHFAGQIGSEPRTMPRLTVNLFSGGKHAGGQVPIQDVLLVPASATTIADGLRMVVAVYQAAAEVTGEQYGTRLLTADEGGLAPPFPDVEAMFQDTMSAVRRAEMEPHRDICLAVDVASSHFFRDGLYDFGHRQHNADEMIKTMEDWVESHAVVSVEDGLAEDDWDGWPAMRQRLAGRALVVGDDFLCTNPARIRQAIDGNCCNTLLLKVNQIGTLSEAAEALQLARSASWHVTISARSGETEDNWLADLAVGWGADQIKVGSITQSERLAKYNRLLEIEAEANLPVVSWPA